MSHAATTISPPSLRPGPAAVALQQTVRRTRRRWLIVACLCGLAWFIAITTSALLLGAAVDMLAPLPVAGRVAALTLTVVLGATVFILGLLKPLLRPPPLMAVAKQIEAIVPGMHNRLISVLDLCRDQHDPNEPFLRRLIEQTTQKLAAYRVQQVVSLAPLQRSALVGGSVVMLGLAMGLIWPHRLPTTLARLLQPTAPIAPASWVRYDVEPGDARALQGDPLTIRANVTRGEPDRLTLRLRGSGAWSSYPMQRQDDGSFSFTLAALSESQQYQVLGGGTWSGVHYIQMVRRPMLEQTSVAVLLPSYMALPQPQALAADARQVSAPLDSEIEVAAKVAGDAQSGEICLHAPQPVVEQAATSEQREVAWVDDATPADAELLGRWRWSSDIAHSGVRAWRLGAPTLACGFATNLHALPLAAQDRLIVYIRPDEADPPGRFRIVVQHSGGEMMLIWDSPQAPAPDELKAKGRYVGVIPVGGQWTRLEIPRDWLGGSDATQVRGLTFQIDRGRLWLDRAGAMGYAQVAPAPQAAPVLERFAMQFDSSSGQWRGRVPVRGDGAWSVRFVGSLGHASPLMMPMPIIATTDAAPAIHVERPGRDVTLDDLQPLPVMVRAFDDYGVWSIGLQIGPGQDKLNPVQWISSYDDPQRSRTSLAAIDPASHDLKPGQTLYYRLVVRDRKSQESHSPIYKLSLAAESEQQTAAKPHDRAQLRSLLDGLAQLINVQGAVSATIGQLLQDDSPASSDSKPPLVPLVMKNHDGTPMTAEQIRGEMQRRLVALSPQQQQALAQQVQQQLAARQDLARELGAEMNAMAESAAQSPLALPDEAQALAAMAQQVAAWAQQQPPLFDATPEQLAAALAQAQQQVQQQQAPLQRLHGQLQQMEQAQQQITQDPELVRQQMQMLLAQQQAQAMQRQLEQARGDVAQRQEQWQELSKELQDLWARFDQAPQDAPTQAEHQTRLDEQLQQMMQRNRELLQPQAPWSKPIDDQRDSRPEDPPPPQIAQQLQKQRQDMKQSLQEHDRELKQADEQLDAAAKDMSRLLDQIGQPSAAGGQQLSLSPQQVAAALQQMSQSPAVRWAQGVAYRAMLQQMSGGSAATAAQPGGAASTGQTPLLPGQVILVEMDPAALQASQRAAVYRLPPKLREPLLQGMAERGPEAYQPLIDGYFRQLSDEVAKP